MQILINVISVRCFYFKCNEKVALNCKKGTVAE